MSCTMIIQDHMMKSQICDSKIIIVLRALGDQQLGNKPWFIGVMQYGGVTFSSDHPLLSRLLIFFTSVKLMKQIT